MKISELIDFSHIQIMVEVRPRAPTGIIDAVDCEILAGIGWLDICVNYHRKHKDSAQRCKESDLHVAKHLKDGKPYGYIPASQERSRSHA